MSMNDPIADLLTRIRNACLRKHQTTNVPYSKVKENIAHLFYKEGFICSIEKTKDNLKIVLKYDEKKNSIIRKIDRISKPGLRIYKNAKNIKPYKEGQGIFVVSTSYGLLSDAGCRKKNIGGEIICSIY